MYFNLVDSVYFWLFSERGAEDWFDPGQRDDRHEVHGEVAEVFLVEHARDRSRPGFLEEESSREMSTFCRYYVDRPLILGFSKWSRCLWRETPHANVPDYVQLFQFLHISVEYLEISNFPRSSRENYRAGVRLLTIGVRTNVMFLL